MLTHSLAQPTVSPSSKDQVQAYTQKLPVFTNSLDYAFEHIAIKNVCTHTCIIYILHLPKVIYSTAIHFTLSFPVIVLHIYLIYPSVS